jgi:hypothetical protein
MNWKIQRIVLATCGSLIVIMGVFVLWVCRSTPQAQNSAIRSIRGRCIDNEDGTPIQDARVIVEFSGPISLRHYGSPGTARKIDIFVVKTDADGTFEVAGEGAFATAKVDARDYFGESWGRRAGDSAASKTVDLTFRLKPFSWTNGD